MAMFGGTSTRQRNAIHPNPNELCPINETKKTDDGQPDSSTGDAIIFVAFAFLVSFYIFSSVINLDRLEWSCHISFRWGRTLTISKISIELLQIKQKKKLRISKEIESH